MAAPHEEAPNRFTQKISDVQLRHPAHLARLCAEAERAEAKRQREEAKAERRDNGATLSAGSPGPGNRGGR